MSVKDLIGEAHYFEETVTPERIKHLLDNVESGPSTGKASIAEKIEGMKYLTAMMARGRDVSEFYPQVVRNVIVKAVEVKKLVYSYLVHYADANATCRELALLAINSFQRDLSDPNQLIRALALRVLCGIRVREIVQIQIMSVKKCATDSSPYVRKTAAHCVGKIHQIDPDTKPELVDIIERLLGDKTTAVLSSAVAAFNEVCSEATDMLHSHYRKMCHLLADLDEWGQVIAIGILQRYARTQFVNPEPAEAAAPTPAAKKASKKGGKKGGKKREFYSDDDEEADDDDEEEEDEDMTGDAPVLPEDHELLLKVSLPLLRSRNSGVVLAVAALHQYLGPKDRAVMGKLGRALVRVVRNHREIQYIVLTNIVDLARQTPDMFRKYIKDFFIAESEPAFVRRMKLEVLAALVSHDNASMILREFTRYVKDDDKDFVKDSIAAIVKIANSLPDIADRCLRGLMALVGTDSEEVVSEAVIAIRQLLQQHPQHDSLVSRLAKRLATTTSPSARSAIVWILGEFQNKPKVAAMAPDALRILAKNFKGEASEVKYQIVNLAAKTALYHPTVPAVQLLLKYILELARYDADYDLRDRARLLRHLMLGTADITALDADAVEEAGAVIAVGAGTVAGVAGHEEAAAEEGAAASAEGAPPGEAGEATVKEDAAEADAAGAPVAPAPVAAAAPPPLAAPAAPALTVGDRVKAVLLASKPPPALESLMNNRGEPLYTFGSLSFMVGHAAKGYHALPVWATEESNSKVRDPPKEEGSRKKKARHDDDDDDEDDDDDDEEEDDDDEDDEEEDDDDEDDEDEEEEEEDDDDDDAPPAKSKSKAVVHGEDDEDDEEEDEEDDEEEEDDDE